MSQAQGIRYDRIFSIKSKSLPRDPKLGKFTALLITKYNAQIPHSPFTTYNSLADVKKHYPSTTSVVRFARNYFGAVNKYNSTPDTLHVLSWTASDAKPALVGGETPLLFMLKKVNGKFRLSIDDKDEDITIDLTQCADLNAMATALQTAIRNANSEAHKKVTVSWNNTSGSFLLKLGDKGNNIAPLGTPSDGNDVSNKLGLSEAEGARVAEFNKGLKNISEVLTAIQERNGPYYIVTFDFEFTTMVDFETCAQWCHESKGDYLVLYHTTDSKAITQYNYLEKYHKYDGVVVDYYPTLHPIGYTAGMISCLDFTRAGGNANLAYTPMNDYKSLAITQESAFDNLEKNRANSFVHFNRMTKGHTWYMNGSIFGNFTTSANVYIGNSYIKFLIQHTYANLFSNAIFIGSSSKDDLQQVYAVTNGIFQSAMQANIIPNNLTLSDEEKAKVRTYFPQTAENAIFSLQSDGYYFELGELDSNSCLPISVIYVANLPLHRICINSFVLRTS